MVAVLLEQVGKKLGGLPALTAIINRRQVQAGYPVTGLGMSALLYGVCNGGVFVWLLFSLWSVVVCCRRLLPPSFSL